MLLGENTSAHPEQDIWSIGCILYALVTGSLPFNGNDYKTIKQNIINGNFTLPQETLDKKISENCMDLVQKIFQTNWQKRITVKEIMLHTWLFAQKPILSFLAQTKTRTESDDSSSKQGERVKSRRSSMKENEEQKIFKKSMKQFATIQAKHNFKNKIGSASNLLDGELKASLGPLKSISTIATARKPTGNRNSFTSFEMLKFSGGNKDSPLYYSKKVDCEPSSFLPKIHKFTTNGKEKVLEHCESCQTVTGPIGEAEDEIQNSIAHLAQLTEKQLKNKHIRNSIIRQYEMLKTDFAHRKFRLSNSKPLKIEKRFTKHRKLNSTNTTTNTNTNMNNTTAHTQRALKHTLQKSNLSIDLNTHSSCHLHTLNTLSPTASTQTHTLPPNTNNPNPTHANPNIDQHSLTPNYLSPEPNGLLSSSLPPSPQPPLKSTHQHQHQHQHHQNSYGVNQPLGGNPNSGNANVEGASSSAASYCRSNHQKQSSQPPPTSHFIIPHNSNPPSHVQQRRSLTNIPTMLVKNQNQGQSAAMLAVPVEQIQKLSARGQGKCGKPPGKAGNRKGRTKMKTYSSNCMLLLNSDNSNLGKGNLPSFNLKIASNPSTARFPRNGPVMGNQTHNFQNDSQNCSQASLGYSITPSSAAFTQKFPHTQYSLVILYLFIFY